MLHRLAGETGHTLDNLHSKNTKPINLCVSCHAVRTNIVVDIGTELHCLAGPDLEGVVAAHLR